jgi:hypothetical protein
MAVFRAKESFALTDRNGVRRVVSAGTLMDGRDPALKGREHLFELAADRPGLRRSAVEDATAEPNSRRSLGRPRGQR